MAQEKTLPSETVLDKCQKPERETKAHGITLSGLKMQSNKL